MNSVFSAFKSSKSDGSISSSSAKKSSSTDTNSYANLRHIREIGSSATMGTFVELNTDDDSIAPNLRLNKTTTAHIPSMDASRSIELPLVAAAAKSSKTNTISGSETVPPINDNGSCEQKRINSNRIKQNDDSMHTEQHSLVNESNDDFSNNKSIPSSLDHSLANETNDTNHSNGFYSATENKENDGKTMPSAYTSESVDKSKSTVTTVDHLSNGHATNTNTNDKHTPVLSAATNRKSTSSADTTTTTTTTTTPNKASTNRLSKRLSLSGIGNSPLPSVHGRSTHSLSNGDNTNGETKRTRISTHQRNLSLDFR